jgi:hypothetical protein
MHCGIHCGPSWIDFWKVSAYLQTMPKKTGNEPGYFENGPLKPVK